MNDLIKSVVIQPVDLFTRKRCTSIQNCTVHDLQSRTSSYDNNCLEMILFLRPIVLEELLEEGLFLGRLLDEQEEEEDSLVNGTGRTLNL